MNGLGVVVIEGTWHLTPRRLVAQGERRERMDLIVELFDQGE